MTTIADFWPRQPTAAQLADRAANAARQQNAWREADRQEEAITEGRTDRPQTPNPHDD